MDLGLRLDGIAVLMALIRSSKASVWLGIYGLSIPLISITNVLPLANLTRKSGI